MKVIEETFKVVSEVEQIGKLLSYDDRCLPLLPPQAKRRVELQLRMIQLFKVRALRTQVRATVVRWTYPARAVLPSATKQALPR